MDGGISFIIITISKIGLAAGIGVGFSKGIGWFHKHEAKTPKNGGGKRNGYEIDDIRKRFHSIKQE